jgi:hypothetical protein
MLAAIPSERVLVRSSNNTRAAPTRSEVSKSIAMEEWEQN